MHWTRFAKLPLVISPGRDAIFKSWKCELAPDPPGIRLLCPIKRTVRADALASTLDNYAVLQELWPEALEKITDTEMKARIQGIAVQMEKFDFFFGVLLGQLILKHSDNLSRTLQKRYFSIRRPACCKLVIKGSQVSLNRWQFSAFLGEGEPSSTRVSTQ